MYRVSVFFLVLFTFIGLQAQSEVPKTTVRVTFSEFKATAEHFFNVYKQKIHGLQGLIRSAQRLKKKSRLKNPHFSGEDQLAQICYQIIDLAEGPLELYSNLNDDFLQFGTDDQRMTLPTAQAFAEFYSIENVSRLVSLRNHSLSGLGFCSESPEIIELAPLYHTGEGLAPFSMWSIRSIEPNSLEQLNESLKAQKETLVYLMKQLNSINGQNQYVDIIDQPDEDLGSDDPNGQADGNNWHPMEERTYTL